MMRRITLVYLAITCCCVLLSNAASSQDSTFELIQIGKMRQVIGMQQHEGRVHLQKLVERPHFFGVAALSGLTGEVTILDGQIFATEAQPSGKIAPLPVGENQQAALLIGGYVRAWKSEEITTSVLPKNLDRQLEKLAEAAGMDTAEPFPFTMTGEFTDVRLHVINGACPVHAKMHGIQVPPEKQPFHREYPTLKGRLVGVFAKDAAGRITHPGTSVHVHVVFKDEETGEFLTAHVEQFGVRPRTVFAVPTAR